MKENGKAESIQGIYHGTGKRFGFVTPEGAEERGQDYFIPPRAEKGAWNGDRVVIQPEEDAPAEAGANGVARVTAVLERANRTLTGVLYREGRELWLQPDSSKLPQPVRVMGKGKRAQAGERAAVAMLSFGGGGHPAMGTLREIFGPASSREGAVSAILWEHDIHRTFPAAVLAAAQAAPEQVEPAALEGRMDLRDKTIITIDGAASKDFDDAVSLERDGQGRWVLGVHIADVSHYVTAGSPLDLEAWERGASVYFADQVVPMLPPEFSNGICSLNPQVDRLTLSCLMTLDGEGAVADYTIAKSVIHSTERMTYEDCNRLLAKESGPLAERYRDILPMLRDMAALSRILARRRRQRGSLDLDTGECVIRCDETGAPVEVLRREPGESEGLIESFMLAANECVAEHLNRLKVPAVYRVHEKPTQSKSEALRLALAPLGYECRTADSFSLQKLLDAVREKPEGPAVSALVLRSMMKARYAGENLGHFGLAARYYCHFTSPIRRYPDLMVHRILTAVLEGKLPGRGEKALSAAVQRAAVQSSQRELAIQAAEREIEKRYLAEYMSAHVGETFQAAVSGVTRFGLFVALSNGVEGMVPVAALPGGAYQYDEARMTLSGQEGGGVYTLGTLLEVVCVSADAASGQIDFRLAGEAAPPLPPAVKHAPRAPRGKPVHRGRKGRRHR